MCSYITIIVTDVYDKIATLGASFYHSSCAITNEGAYLLRKEPLPLVVCPGLRSTDFDLRR